ncbi:hypothetical protein F2Q70_00043441 [Brassica cretica]|uniref:Uncharacterized protein n=1 Tax=Brassica cretica TaxID=69181 RepID=A0A8S9KI10_BRACR|nr:hypothetical protein F2Q70_00043441 [Brassica cretica]
MMRFLGLVLKQGFSDTSDHEHSMEKTTDHLHRQTVNSTKNCLTWRSKLEQQMQLLRQLKTKESQEKMRFRYSGGKSMQIAAKALYHKLNHNTVGGLGEEALFPVYWNGDNRPVLRVQKRLQNTWSFHIITRSGAEECLNPLGFFASHVDLQGFSDTSDHEHSMEKTTDHLHRQTVNSKKNCLTWRSKLEQQLQLKESQGHQPPQPNGSHQLHISDVGRKIVALLGHLNHNTVGGLDEEALFPVYWNGDNRPVLRV